MSFLRSLASLVGRVFQRIARALLTWSRGSGESGGGPAAELWQAPDDGPPEHWLRYIRQRAPWLVRGRRPGLPGVPARATRAAAEPPEPAPTRASGARPEPPGALRARHRVVLPGPAAPPAHAEPPRPEPDRRLAYEPAGRSVSGSPTPQPARAPTLAKVVQPLAAPSREPPREEHLARARAAVPVRALRAARVNLAGESPASPEAVRPPPARGATVPRDEWPQLPPGMLTGEGSPEFAAPDSPVAAGRADFIPVASRAFGARTFPEPAPEGRTAPGAYAPAPGERESPEDERWPELPDMRWRGEAWPVPSSRSLVREQLRLTRLLAEQAGSSWSGPPS